MSCIIALKDAGKVYMGCDQRVTFTPNPVFVDNKNKILDFNGLLMGFAGPRGIQDLFELFIPDLKSCKYPDMLQKLIGILLMINQTAGVLVSDGNTIDVVTNLGNLDSQGQRTSSGHYYNVVGCGYEIVENYFSTCDPSLPPEIKIKEAINLVAKRYYTVGGEPLIYHT